MCGEKPRPSWAYARAIGSPPRVRGKVTIIRHISMVDRITPACAGKSMTQSAAAQCWWDHPRVCGEKSPCPRIRQRRSGSPPRVRGKGQKLRAGPCYSRITPACAGKRLAGQIDVVFFGDHPRVCGEKDGRGRAREAGKGSPPRVRGKAEQPSLTNELIGITPACAGKRQSRALPPHLGWDHPRVCGEKTKKSVENKGISNAELCDFI